MRNKIFIHIFFILLAFIITIATTYSKIEVIKHSDLENLSCGWPLKFIVNDDSTYDPPMPWKAVCGFLRSPIEDGRTKEFYLGYFFLDAMFFYLLILLVFYGARQGYKIIILKS